MKAYDVIHETGGIATPSEEDRATATGSVRVKFGVLLEWIIGASPLIGRSRAKVKW